MDVSCPACAARYTTDEQKLKGKTARMRCKACDTVWLVSGPSDSEKRAAVVKRGAEREKRDMFATRPPDLGSVKQTLRPPPPGAASREPGVAARNETSVLFTVEEMRDNARLKTPAPEAARAGKPEDDEGIIDLNALASSPPKALGRELAPLFPNSETPPGAFARDARASEPSPARAGRNVRRVGIVGGAVAVVALAGVAIAFAFRGEEPIAHAAAVVPPPPPVTAAAPAPAPPTPDPTPAATSSDDTKAASAATEGKKKGKKRKSAKSASASDGTVAVAAPKPAKAADTCGCHGDFDCIIRCTAKGK